MQPVPPWIYRKVTRGQSLDLSDLAPLESEPRVAVLLAAHHNLVRLNLSPCPIPHPPPYPIIGKLKSHILPSARLSQLQPDCATQQSSV